MSKWWYWYIKLTIYPFGFIYIMILGVSDFFRLVAMFDKGYDYVKRCYEEKEDE